MAIFDENLPQPQGQIDRTAEGVFGFRSVEFFGVPIPKSTVLAKRTKAESGSQQPLRKPHLTIGDD